MIHRVQQQAFEIGIVGIYGRCGTLTLSLIVLGSEFSFVDIHPGFSDLTMLYGGRNLLFTIASNTMIHMSYRSKQLHAQNSLLHSILDLYSYTFLVLLFLSAGLASAQSDQGFSLTKFDNQTIGCTGKATLTPDENTLPGSICLTPNDLQTNDTIGRCFHNNPIHFQKSTKGFSSFSTMFSFTTLTFLRQFPGQGFTFFIGPDKTAVGGPGGYLGWLNSTTDRDQNGHNFAVEFDIVLDDRFADPNNNHVGVNVGSLSSILWASPDFNLKTYSSEDVIYAWIEYDGDKGTIEVSLSQMARKPCKPLISGSLQLQNILNMETMYVGFTSSSGSNANAQTTVWNWSFNASTTAKAKNIYGKNAHCGPKWKLILGLTIAALVAMVWILLVPGLIFVLCKKTRRLSDLEKEKAALIAELNNFSDLEKEKAALIAELNNLDYGAREFTYDEILEATKEFEEEIGHGGFGTVYKGSLSNLMSSQHSNGNVETIVAVKKITRSVDTIDDARQLVAEVKVIGRLRHMNMVPLLGWCYDRGRRNPEMLLVYKYMEKGDLHMHLFPDLFPENSSGTSGPEVLSWQKRMRILTGVASAVEFLHEHCEQRVVHRDIKTRNVMIDHSFNARLGDFGLARSYNHTSCALRTEVYGGTVGYMAPECVTGEPATTNTDVYSFGVLALEVATGRQVSSLQLVNRVRKYHDLGELGSFGDRRLQNDNSFNQEELKRVLLVGLFCCAFEAENRPTMRMVLSALQDRPSILSSSLPPHTPAPEPIIPLDAMTSTSVPLAPKNPPFSDTESQVPTVTV